MENKIILTQKELKSINGGGRFAKNLGYYFHYFLDHMYKAALIESQHSHTGHF